MNVSAGPVGVIRAELTPFWTKSGYRWTIEAAGLTLESRYPVNRMAKVLFDRGYRGRLETFGPSADGKRIILRLSCDIEKMAARRLSETSVEGFRRVPWDDAAVAALNRAVRPIIATVDGGEAESGPSIPAAGLNDSSGTNSDSGFAVRTP